jgi:hypothetical protein
VQERGNGPFFVEAMLGGEIKHIDAAQRAIGCFSNRTLDGANTISIGDCLSTLKRASISLTL